MDKSDELGLAEIASKVHFSTEQVARMCAVSRRQLAYWAQKGIIPTRDGYALDTVEKVVLIRREIDNGRSLKRAVEKVEERLARRAAAASAVEGMSTQDLAVLCDKRMEGLESLLQMLRARLPQLGAEQQQRAAAEVAALRIERVLGPEAPAVSPEELACWLDRAAEHLQTVVEDPGEPLER